MNHTHTRRPRLALATSAELAALHPDDLPLAVLLAQQGIDCTPCVWNDPAVDWAAFDAVLIRSIWDYFQHYPAFLDWLQRLQSLRVPSLNPLNVLRWNSDKAYLLELEQAGIPVVSSRQVRGGDLLEAVAKLDPHAELVVKPAVSGGAWHTVRGRPADPGFRAALSQLPPDLKFLLQPYLPEIAALGEWSLLYFGADGAADSDADCFSHAVLKRPAAGDYRVQTQHGGSTERLDPPAEIRAAADAVLSATRSLLGSPLTYARVDGVWCGGRFLLMEIELIEPYLFLSVQPGAVEKLATAVRHGLGLPA